MKLRFLLPVVLGFCATLAFGEKPFPAEEMPGNKLITEETVTSKIAEPIQKLLLKQDVFADESGKLPEKLFVGKFDLNGDGRPEILVEDPASYTGGKITYILETSRDAYSVLGSFQGIQYLGSPVNGYAQIITFSRSGANVYVRELYVFKNGKYESVRAAEYEIDDGDKEKYLKEVQD